MRCTFVIMFACIFAFSGTVFADVTSPYGINAHVPNNQVLDLITAAEIGWIRIDMNWFQMEPSCDNYNWGYMDSVVNNAAARGLEIFATLAYTPSWANGTGNIADPPTDILDWYDFVFDTVSRYSNKVKYWGMWNEPNLDSFFTGTGWQYREWILKPGSQAAKAADPSCFVLGPELAHLSSSDWPDWMEEAMTSGGASHIDIITHHCYKGDTGAELFNYLDEGAFHFLWDPPPLGDVLKDLGVDDKPVWLTETGWHTPDYKDDVSESEQAENYHQLLWGIYSRDSIEKVFPYEIIDDPNASVPKWGIIRSDYVTKLAYDTYHNFILNPTDPGTGSTCGLSTGRTRADAGIILLALIGIAGLIARMKR